MKSIINRKKYDTETATEIQTITYGQGKRDFKHFEETLYRKKTGEFFLAGEGGPMSKYSHFYSLENMWGSGSRIIPLTLDEAKDWVSENCSADDYEELFGPVEE